ncbi:MAG: ABC transporter permease subunit [Oscillospiraceae bacterium]|nr:ABC transporter permease subunit [Oscillospiraceae bacterium]
MANAAIAPSRALKEQEKKLKRHLIKRDFRQNWPVYLMLVPVIAYFIIFHYLPMGGLAIAFEDFSFRQGFFGSPFVGFKHFENFFSSIYFGRLLSNTLILSAYGFLISFPLPIVLALLLNEVRQPRFKKTVQTISYLPYFISVVVVVGILQDFTKSNGLLTQLVVALGGEGGNLLGKPEYFRALFIGSNVWAHIGYSSIIYISALSGIDQELYEAARIDGAGRWKQTLHVTLPGLAPTIIILFIMRLGEVMTLDYEKILLMYGPGTYSTADIIQTYVYRVGLVNGDYSYASAVGLFNSVINFIVIFVANKISSKVSETSLW